MLCVLNCLPIVSMLALDDYSNLQRKYAVEMQCRAQAEKLAAEVDMSTFVYKLNAPNKTI